VYEFKSKDYFGHEDEGQFEQMQKYVENKGLEWMLEHLSDHEAIKVYDFEEIGPLPTYLYTINAGPYEVYHHHSIFPDSPP